MVFPPGWCPLWPLSLSHSPRFCAINTIVVTSVAEQQQTLLVLLISARSGAILALVTVTVRVRYRVCDGHYYCTIPLHYYSGSVELSALPFTVIYTESTYPYHQWSSVLCSCLHSSPNR